MATQTVSIPSHEFIQAVGDGMNFLIEMVDGAQAVAIFASVKPSVADIGHAVTPDKPLSRLGVSGALWLRAKGASGGNAIAIVSIEE